MQNPTRISKLISKILRHKPEMIGITLDSEGWADTQALIAGIQISQEMLEEIVNTDAKQRYSFNEDKSKIRANYGHSVKIIIHYPEKEPPEFLYHGTAERFLPSIQEKGLLPMQRLYVHLSKDIETAITVGKRHGKPYVFKIPAKAMQEQGYIFYQAPNGVWLTKLIPANFLENIAKRVD
ncbi:MAG: RNA 2'-phosphotransferase [Oscillospiraceae bacterium]|nr:RNA 2'-phosphotransferase [Ruminococcus sp.]MDE6707733.1 RNA 2'-phosphotransferase [Oscillospiraceae bacterium]